MPTPSLFQLDPELPEPPRRKRLPRSKPRHTDEPRSERGDLLKRSPLLDANPRALQRLLALPAAQPSHTWVLEGASAWAQFRSLAQHRLAAYPVPEFMWRVFLETPRRYALFVPVLRASARGDSLFQFMNSGEFPVRLTRPQCHALWAAPAERPFHEALRRAQAHKLAPWVTEELLLTEWGRELFNPGIEAQWTLWVDWLATRTDLSPGQIGPLSDFVTSRLEAGFGLKGRTAASLQAAMEAWHEELARDELHARPAPRPMPRSGFAGATWSTERDGFTEHWSIEEIVTPEALFEEGARMHHCVFTYMNRIWAGTSSIWSLGRVLPDHRNRLVTIQVRNAEREIVQIRGPCNRAPTGDEMELIRHWAAQAGPHLPAVSDSAVSYFVFIT